WPASLVAAMTASTYDDWFFRIAVFVLVWKLEGRLWWCLARSWKVVFLLSVLAQVQGAQA
nr:protein p7 [Hepacivirus vittatae]